MKFIDVANVAWGFHAGDPETRDATIVLAKENGVKVGARPGLPDLAGFGRRAMNLTVDLNFDSGGNLIILRKPHTTDPAAAERVTRALTDGTVVAEDGTAFSMEFSSICVHSDAANSPDVAAAVREALEAGQA